MRVDNQNTQPITGAPRATTPIPTAEPRVRMGNDALALGTNRVVAAAPPTEERDPAKQGENILDDSVGRKAVDVTSGAAGAADGARSIKPTADAIKAATSAGKLSWLGQWAGAAADWFSSVGAKVASTVKFAAPLASGLAKAAPGLGVLVGVLDVGKAIIEQNPEKKQKATGMAVMSCVSGLAGVVGFAGAAGMAVFGVALAPVAVPAMIIGGVVTAVALADQFLLGGKVAKAIGGAVDAVGDGLGKAWNALTSL